MMADVPKISYAFSQYDSHRLCAKCVVFYHRNIMQSMQTDLTIIYMVTDQKQKYLQMIYWEGKVIMTVKKA